MEELIVILMTLLLFSTAGFIITSALVAIDYLKSWWNNRKKTKLRDEDKSKIIKEYYGGKYLNSIDMMVNSGWDSQKVYQAIKDTPKYKKFIKIDRVITLHNAGYRQKDIAKELGVTQSNISKILKKCYGK